MRILSLLTLALYACEAGSGPKAEPIDADRDGYTEDVDCDDAAGGVSPGEVEVPYDGIDNDCDEATPDDDVDQDGYTADVDCDDLDATVHPGATELPYDGVDNDCEASTSDEDVDGDGYTAGDDCDDNDATVNPAAEETCDERDEDCDGETDESGGSLYYADADGDGYGDPTSGEAWCTPPDNLVSNGEDCDDSTATAFPGNPEVCDEVDNDCDGTVDEDVTTTFYVDTDGDGFGSDASTVEACAVPTGYAATDDDCDDADGAVNPDAAELCDGVDNDCDTTVDEDDALDASTWYADDDGDGYGDADTSTNACEVPTGYVADDEDCDDTDPDTNPDTVWYIDYDGDGYGSADFTLSQCTQPAGYLATATDCDDSDSAVNLGATEVCNNVDDDCDALIDDDDDSLDLSSAEVWYADTDGDGYGDATVASQACDAPSATVADDTDCDDTDADIHPDAAEGWFDGIDSDCDGDEDPDACDDDPPASTVAIDAACTWAPTVGSFNPTTEWSVSTFTTEPNSKHILMTPVVGQLTDDDVDGDIDSDDTPDIAVVTFNRTTSSSAGVLRILSGDDGTDNLSIYGATYGANTYYPYRYSNLALGDVDKDGEAEIIATLYRSSYCYLGAYALDGTLEWVNTTVQSCRSHAPALADLEADGDVEVIYGRQIFNGADGSAVATGAGGSGYYSSYSNSGYMSFAADLDLDGDLEVLAGSSVYTSTGLNFCTTGDTDGYPGAANLDGDSEGEFVVVAGGTVRLYDTDCTELDTWSVYGGGYGGPPTIADYDGDGEPEIGLPGDDYYTVYEVDGTRLWSKAIDDASSHSTGSSVFDFDGDGQAEVVYADETSTWVFDGATGAVLLQDTAHGSGTINEYPVIADVDGDGNAEIIIANDYTAYGVQVIGDADDNWVSARQVWNQHAYNITNIEDDLSIPTVPDNNWTTYNSFRQGAPGGFNATDAPNVYPVTYTACQDACGDDVTVYVQIANDGLIRASSSVELTLYGEDSTGALTVLESTTLGTNLDSGELSAPQVFAFSAAEITPYVALVARVDGDASTNECDEADNDGTVDISAVCE